MGTLTASIVRNVVLPLWMRRDHPRCRRYLAEFQRSQFLELAALREVQLRRLKTLLVHAYRNCPFYQRRMDEAGVSAEGISSLNALSALPVLSKRDIQDNAPAITARQFPVADRLGNQTGGSTGSPLRFFVDRERLDSRMASTIRHNAWAGLRPGDWYAELWGARLDQHLGDNGWDWVRNNVIYRTISLNTSQITEERLERFLAAVRHKRPQVLLAYAQSAVLLAGYLRERGCEDIRFKSIITTAEVLLPGQRQVLEMAFQAPVFNRYGCREVSVIASECEHHQGMHVNAEALLVEIVPDAGFQPPAGRLLVTDLLNFSMPLIRYEIGDVGVWADGQCPCGRGLPRLAQVEGRITDFLTLSDGRRVSGPALTLVVADMEDIRQAQFVQTTSQTVVMRVVPGPNYGSHTAEELRRRLGCYLDASTGLSIETVGDIAREISGKYRFVINLVQPPPSSPGGSECAQELRP